MEQIKYLPINEYQSKILDEIKRMYKLDSPSESLDQLITEYHYLNTQITHLRAKLDSILTRLKLTIKDLEKY